MRNDFGQESKRISTESWKQNKRHRDETSLLHRGSKELFSGGKGPLSNVSEGTELPVTIHLTLRLHSPHTADIYNERSSLRAPGSRREVFGTGLLSGTYLER